ncbi:hypothetical protein BDW66DRAFT_132699 [Aspergillus desertorum]
MLPYLLLLYELGAWLSASLVLRRLQKVYLCSNSCTGQALLLHVTAILAVWPGPAPADCLQEPGLSPFSLSAMRRFETMLSCSGCGEL